jgi:hypothetical protein
MSTESLPSSAEPSDSVPTPTTTTTDNAVAAANNNSNDNDSNGSKSRPCKPDSKPDEAKAVNGAHSQPMAVSDSTSSEVTAIMDAAGAPYSTRSRGRNGAPRPNYAEDIEMDFELTSPAPKPASGPAAKRTQIAASSANGSPSRAADSDKGPAASTRKNQQAQPNAAAKDAIPGTSTFSAGVASNGSSSASATRKRKQPPNGATGANPNGSAKRQLTNASGPKRDIRLSNMMSFGNSGARLKNGKLRADDGTTLEVNGELNFFFLTYKN